MIFLIAVGVILVPLLIGGLIAWGSVRFSHAVETTKVEVENADKGLNPAVTFGHEVEVDASPEEMLKQARLEAARKAAALPRGANMRIGRKGQSNLRTAGSALDEDPMTAVRIAIHHGWDGARTGAVAAVATPAAAPAPAAAAPSVDIEPPQLIEITDDMPPDEMRKARIANSKAKSAFNKALKAAGVDPSTVEIVDGKVVLPGGAPVSAAAAAPVGAAPAQSVNIEPPQLIEITDDMDPDELRKARIANSKAKSAFNKALKAAGVDPKKVEIVDGKVVLPGGAPVAAAGAPAAAAPAATAPAQSVNIEPPQLTEITDDMPPDELRAARIANSKAKSAFNKALKAAGVDPKDVEIVDDKVVISGGAPVAAAAPAPAAQAAPAAAPAAAEPAAAAANIPQPELVEITDDMSPDEIRAARIANSKAKSAYNKALKAAGIDPKSVK